MGNIRITNQKSAVTQCIVGYDLEYKRGCTQLLSAFGQGPPTGEVQGTKPVGVRNALLRATTHLKTKSAKKGAKLKH